MTALDENSKADTKLLTYGPGAANLLIDVSQERTNLTNNTTCVSESSSARAAIVAPREISIVVDLRSTDTAFLLEHGNGDGTHHTYRVEVLSSFGVGYIICREGGVLRATAELPDAEVTPHKFLIHWSTRPDGASYRSELLLYNFDENTWSTDARGHGAGTTDATWDLVINGDGAGAGGLAAIGDFYSVRIGQRFHSMTEGKEDWVFQAIPPTIDARRRSPMLPLLDVLADEGEHAGPGYGQPLANTRSVELRNGGALVNMRPKLPYQETNAYAPTRYFRSAPGSTMHWCTRYIAHAVVSPKHNRARVRIHVQQWKTNPAGAAQCDLLFTCWSAAWLPLVGGQPKPMETTRTVAVTINANHTSSGVGEWLDLGTLKLTMEQDRRTYLILGFTFNNDAGTAGEANTSFKIKAWTVEPYRDDSGLAGDMDFDNG